MSALPSEKCSPLTKEDKINMHLVFRVVFGASIDRWSKYVDLIAESDFLRDRFNLTVIFKMPDSEQVPLAWAVQPHNCLGALAGLYSGPDDYSGQKHGLIQAEFKQGLSVELASRVSCSNSNQ